MSYPDTTRLKALAEELALELAHRHERGVRGAGAVLLRAERALAAARRELTQLRGDASMAAREPEDLRAIRALRPRGPRRLWARIDDAAAYRDRLAGAFLGRAAGCALGAPVELWPVAKMEDLARENGECFPPRDYWGRVPEPFERHYETSPRSAYTRGGMRGIPVDDDLMYTLLGLLIVEEHGHEFSTEDVAAAWLKYLPFACTAEKLTLERLRRRTRARRAGAAGNPYCEWIGADIRCDAWGYLAPGWPERAAALAWRDARLSHRWNGVYGAMFFAATIAAAFAVGDTLEAVRIGLTEIPRECALARAVRWALRRGPEIRDYRAARTAVDRRFAGMDAVHTINNACLTIFGLHVGGRDFSRVIGETVAMGLDNDCTAATAGSIFGAAYGRAAIPVHWTRPFGDTMLSYLRGVPRVRISEVLRRFARSAATGPW